MEASMSEAQGFAHPEFLVETDRLAAQLGDPKLIVLDCTMHLIPDPKITYTVKPGREDFEKGHIPGAQFVDLQEDLSAKHPKLRFLLPNAGEFAAAMGRFGVGAESRGGGDSPQNPPKAGPHGWFVGHKREDKTPRR
jgi:thiosulfate/3-mercaptopyruvate sulfurtransferase